MNKGFSFYENMWTAVANFPEDQQKEAIWAICKYGITGELVDATKYPIGAMAAGMVKPSIDASVERYNSSSVNGTKGGRPSKVTDEEIKEYLSRNPNATSSQVAEEFGISASSVQKKDVWKNRKLINDKENAGVVIIDSNLQTTAKPKFDF